MAALAAWLALEVPYLRPNYTFDYDAGNFARAGQRFDVAAHQPQPPGFPLYVLIHRGATRLARTPQRGMAALSLLFTLGALLAFWGFARELCGAKAALAAAVLLAFSPPVRLHAVSQTTYAVDLLASAVTGWLAFRVWRGQARLAVPLGVLAGIFSALRPPGGFLLSLLVVVALARLLKQRPVWALGGAAALGATNLAWLAPVAASVGGWSNLRAISRANSMWAIGTTSVFFGGSPRLHYFMIRENAYFILLALCGLVAAMVFVRRFPTPSRIAALFSRGEWLLFAAWVLPGAAAVFLLHGNKPGYVLLIVPPLALILTRALVRLEVRSWTAAAAAGLAVAVILQNLPYERWMRKDLPDIFYLTLRATPGILRHVERNQERFAQGLRTLAPGTQIEVFRTYNEGPNYSTVRVDFPEYRWLYRPGDDPWRVVTGGYGLVEEPAEEGSPRAWLCTGTGLPTRVARSNPQAKLIAEGLHFKLYAAGP